MKVKAADVMVPVDRLPVVSENECVDRAAEALVRSYDEMESVWRDYEALLVVNSLNEAVGLLTLRSILRAIEINGEGRRTARFFPGIKKNSGGIPVKDLMRPLGSCSVEPDDGLDRVARVIMESNANSVPVRSGNRLAGVIRAIDLFWYINEML